MRLAKHHGVALRQSYTRVGKFALIQHQRYAHAKQFKRANRMLKKLRTLLGRVIRDITRKIESDSGLEAAFAQLLMLARRVREQQQRQRGPKVYSPARPGSRMHRQGQGPPALRVRRQGQRCHHHRPRQGRPVRHPVKSMPGNPYDGHTLATVIPQMEALVGNTLDRIPRRQGISRPLHRPITSSGSSSPARNEASHLRSNASCAAGQPLSP